MPDIPRIFIAYARKDADLLAELRTHLRPLERTKRAIIWYDGNIEPGAVWEEDIKKNLHAADIILLLLSAHAIDSDYFYEKELSDALERHEQGTARVVPLIVRPCAWRATPLAKIQALPKDGKPVTSWHDREEAWNDAVETLLNFIEERERKALLEKEAEEQRRRSVEAERQRKTAEEKQRRDEAARRQKEEEERQRQAKADNLKELTLSTQWGSKNAPLTLQSLKNQLKLLAAVDLPQLFKRLEETLVVSSAKFNDFILLTGQYFNSEQEWQTGRITRESYYIAETRVFSALLDLIDHLEPQDLEYPFEEKNNQRRRSFDITGHIPGDAKYTRDTVGDALSGGKGKGNIGRTGNHGDPNSDILSGISTGSGVVGGGLDNRGVMKRGAPISDNLSEEGTVYLDVCVDKDGNVISAEYTQRGSTTNNSRLKQLAIQNAKQWRFSKGQVDKQCGTIRYDFKLK